MRPSRVYLDHAATSPLRPVARDAMTPLWDMIGNASSLHSAGRAARAVLEEAREELAVAVDAHPTEVVFTSGGTEADNLAVHGSWIARRVTGPAEPHGRTRVVMSAIEHHAVHDLAPVLERDGGQVTRLGVGGDGRVAPEQIDAALSGDEGAEVAVASLMWVNNETGAIQPVAHLAQAARSVGAWSHADAVQALGHLPVSFRDSGLDMMALSAHKIGGPVGIGALVVRRDVSPAPVIHGGGQERGIRSGTHNPVLAAGFAAAATEAVDQFEARIRGWGELRERFLAGTATLDTVPHVAAESVPSTINIAFGGCEADDLLLVLDAAGIDVSVGSACTAGVSQTSHVLLAAGIDESEARSSLRFSLGPDTTAEEIDRVIAVLPDAVERARAAGRVRRPSRRRTVGHRR